MWFWWAAPALPSWSGVDSGASLFSVIFSLAIRTDSIAEVPNRIPRTAPSRHRNVDRDGTSRSADWVAKL